MNLQVINLADNINAAIDKMNENFDELRFLDSAYFETIFQNFEFDSAQVDSAAILAIIGETGLEGRIDSVEGGVTLLSQQYTNLETSYQSLDSGFTALSTANASLTSSITVLDSSITVLSQDVVDLGVELNNLTIDSDLIVNAVGNAVSELTSRIDVNSDGLTVISQDLTSLESRIDGVDSEFALTATAVSNLTTRVNLNSDEFSAISGRFDSFQVTFQDALDSGIRVNSDDIAAAVGGITGDLYTRIYANSDAIAVVSADVVGLNSKLTLLDSDGALFDVISTADQVLRTEVISRDSDNLAAAKAEFTTALESYIDSDTLASADQTLRTYVQEQDSNGLAAAIAEFETRLETYVDSSSFATATESLQTQIDGIDVNAQYALELNANNYITGIYLETNGSRSDFTVQADAFNLVPSSPTGERMEMSGSTMTIFDANGNPRVRLGDLS